MIVIDPRKIHGPAMFPMTKPAYATARSGGMQTPVHSHRAYVNAKGDGQTDFAAGHSHLIVARQILPAVDGHTHPLTNIPNGSGI
jgi:hypothetical protein